MIPTSQDLEGAIYDVLRPIRAISGVFWALHSKPCSEEEQTIIDLCLMMEQIAKQVMHLIEHAQIEGKSVAFATITYPSSNRIKKP